ncbi:MAG: CBS domain-containing protein [Desulfosarcina sp.]
MKATKVYEWMVPLSEYAAVPISATLGDAVEALIQAQKDFIRWKYPHRAILVVDANEHVVGKISQTHVLKALEPKYFEELGIDGDMGIHRLSNYILKTMVDKYSLFKEPFDEACKRAAQIPIKKIMYTPKEADYIDKAATLGEAIHRLVVGCHQSLLVREEAKVIGILRLTDVFCAAAAVMHPDQACSR